MQGGVEYDSLRLVDALFLTNGDAPMHYRCPLIPALNR